MVLGMPVLTGDDERPRVSVQELIDFGKDCRSPAVVERAGDEIVLDIYEHQGCVLVEIRVELWLGQHEPLGSNYDKSIHTGTPSTIQANVSSKLEAEYSVKPIIIADLSSCLL